ncbi:UNVERIFIED_CONTAM: Vacuolar-sorting protein BRO1 [Sesamum angustifolium]|uniref:Vacuolar-sorting protein BRO1 n=1 Tax=Sesamum angustifolium TaxID=2727405 RepID=A0AAW2M659_9LAMI
MASPSSTTTTNIMLAIFEKKTNSLDLYRPLRNFIVINYSEREAQNLEDDLETLKQLRSDVERGGASDSPSARRDLLQNYYKALCAVESRFPISPDADHVNTVSFTWFDAFKTKQKAAQQNIHLEKAAVLFNLGAVHSQMGLSFDRSAVEGRRQASHSFIAAAGAFAFLRDNVAMKASVGSSTTLDVSVECVGMLERLMLAQAQECVYENTIAKGSSPAVCAKISRQVGLFYEEALAALSVAPLNQHFDKAWIAHVQLKAALFYAEACYRYSLELHDKEEIAEEIARLKSGVNALSEAKKSSPRGAAQQLLDAINKLETNLNRNLERAVKENDRVYLMRVPPASSLAPLPTFSMVKPLPMNEVLDASKEKMFATLVPDNSAKALSRESYSANSFERRCGGSTDLWGPAGLEGELQQLKDLRRVNHELLDRLNRFAGNLKQAAESDARIERSVREHSALMSILDRRPIESALPTLAKPMMSLDANEDAVVGALKQSLRQLETLGAQRAGLEDMLKEMKRKDDILPKLMTSTGSHEDLFRKEISKYDSIAKKLLKTSKLKNSYYCTYSTTAFSMQIDYHVCSVLMFPCLQSSASREKGYRQIEAAIAKFREIKENINEGLKFYVTLQDAITIKQQCSDFVMTRNIQCRDMIDDVQRQISGLSFQDGKSSTVGHSFPSAGPPYHPQRSNSQQQLDVGNMPNSSHPQPPAYQPPQQPIASGYAQTPYGSQQQPPPPYHAPVSGPYPSPQHQPPAVSHEYGQPAYPGWRGPYYNAPPQQPGSMPRPPYTVPSPYPPHHQSGYYRQ